MNDSYAAAALPDRVTLQAARVFLSLSLGPDIVPKYMYRGQYR